MHGVHAGTRVREVIREELAHNYLAALGHGVRGEPAVRARGRPGAIRLGAPAGFRYHFAAEPKAVALPG